MAKSDNFFVVEDGGMYRYSDQINQLPSLPPSTYNMQVDMMGNVFYVEEKPTNDQAIEVDNQSRGLITEISEFLGKREVFRKFGFAHKRGYILYGPPGCGKSTTLRLLQKNFCEAFNGIALLWRNGLNFKTHLRTIRKYEGISRPIMVVCEDIDNMLGAFETEVLELLDGQTALNNFVLVATTNYLRDLPERIRNRPSRIDRLVKIDYPSESARKVYLNRLGLVGADCDRIAKATGEMSMAHLKEVVIATVCLGNSLEETVTRLRNIPAEVAKGNSRRAPKIQLAKKLDDPFEGGS